MILIACRGEFSRDFSVASAFLLILAGNLCYKREL